MLPGIKAKTILLCTLLSHSLGYHVKSKKLIKKKKYQYVFWNVLKGLLVLLLGTTILMMKATWAQLIILQSLFWCAIYELYEKCCGSTEMKMKNFIKAIINTFIGMKGKLRNSHYIWCFGMDQLCYSETNLGNIVMDSWVSRCSLPKNKHNSLQWIYIPRR